MQTLDPNTILQESIKTHLAQTKQSKDIDLTAYAAAIIHSHSINDSVDLDITYLNDLEP